MNSFAPDSKFARVIDLTLDLLVVLILLAAPLVFYTQGNDVFEFNKITAVRDFSALAACLFLAKLLFVRPLELLRASTDFPLLAWLAVCFVATANTINLTLSLHGVYEDFEGITTLVNYAFLMFLVQQQIRSERQIRMVIGAIILAGTVMGFYGILQNVNIDFVPWNPATYSADRMFSTMGNPNFLAAYLVMSLPVCLVVFLDLPNRIHTDKLFSGMLIVFSLFLSVGLWALFNVNYFNFEPAYYEVTSFGGIFLTTKFWAMHVLLIFPVIAALLIYRGWLKIFFLLSMIFQVVAILFTKSRGAGIALAVIVVLFAAYFLWDIRRNSEVIKRNKWWLISFGISILLAQLFPGVRDTTTHLFVRLFDVFQPQNFRLTPRLYIWRSALQMLRDHFWFGTGLDTFQIAFPKYRTAIYWILEWNGTPEKAHNMVMQIAATMGIFGLISFFWLLSTFGARVFADLKEQLDSSRRLLIIGCFVGVLAFFAQNLFSFTVVGYGVTFWMLMGFLPAMQRTWKTSEAEVAGTVHHPQSLTPWRVAVGLISLMGLLCLLAGTYFHLKGEALGLRWVLFAFGVVALGGLLASVTPSRARAFALTTLALTSLGYFIFAVYSTRIWMADRFFKQGQVGGQVGNPAYSAMMYQKAAGHIENLSPEQERGLLVAEPPSKAAGDFDFVPGLNPDQELYWVKMGIAFESAAAAAQTAEEKFRYYRTALAIHQLTLGMNPINGYNYNNKGRVLKSMGEVFGRADFLRAALEHYRQATKLDSNNVYFNMDYASTYVDLGEWDNAMGVVKGVMEHFPDFALAYSYAGFIDQRKGNLPEAVAYFQQSMSKDFKGDRMGKAVAATNLGMILTNTKGGDVQAQQAFNLALQANPDIPDTYINFAKLHLKYGRKAEAIRVLKAYQQRNPNHEGVNKMLKSLGA